MKKIILTVGIVSREANANEYPLRGEPKSTPVTGTANGAPSRVRFTSGKGKSAINNHYLYWVEGETLFYTRVSADEIAKAKVEPIVIADASEPQAAIPSPIVTPSKDDTNLGIEAVTPEPRKLRRAKATA